MANVVLPDGDLPTAVKVGVANAFLNAGQTCTAWTRMLVHRPHEAAAIANDSRYGLAGGVWSADRDRAVRFARRLRTGAVDVNGAPYNPLAPFGGYKHSGIGRELGRHGLEEFLELKPIQL